MTTMTNSRPLPRTTGKVFHWPRSYDLLLRVLWGGAEAAYREKVIELARLQPGETVLDVGCGTGTLAIAAGRRVGPAGRVHGIDASPAMIARARRKAAAARVAVVFKTAIAEVLPFADATFDAVVSTTVLHCLPDAARRQSVAEMRRVLKPGGRLLAVDFGGPAHDRRSLIGHLSHHRRFDLSEVIPLLRDVGLIAIESGAVDFSDLQFVLAQPPAA
jgi:ubiquinone/menaquinone biosynthesis C-methylase UbiE